MMETDIRIGPCPCYKCDHSEPERRCRKACKDWAIWKIRQVQVNVMDQREAQHAGRVSSYEIERSKKIKKRYKK